MADRLPTKSHLERLVAAYAQTAEVGHTRIRRWVSTMVLVGALGRVRGEDDSDHFVIKGGLAMELRLGSSARATADVDATFYGDRTLLEQALRDAFALPLSGFTFRVANSRIVGAGSATRSSVRLEYQGKPWAAVELELSSSEPPSDIEFVPAFSLEHFGLTGPAQVATLSARYQLAQKLHAVSERFETGPNSRVRDVIDILLLRGVLPSLEHVREACIDVFAARGMHSWPPTIVAYDDWESEYDRLRDNIAFDVTTMQEALIEVHGLITAIDGASDDS